MSLEHYLWAMPKVELHVHLEGSIQPETLLRLAERYQVALPVRTLKEVRDWYRFTDFAHFVDIYLAISSCLRTVDDIELVTREFLVGQAAQSIYYTEITYTPFTHYASKGISYRDQLAALNRARAWAAAELGVQCNFVMDIPRQIDADDGLMVADWVIDSLGDGVVALGLGGPEIGNPPEKFKAAFARAREAGVPRVPHAGETDGAASIWGALRSLDAQRIGHGVRCLEDPKLVDELRAHQIPLEVCPSSNVCLGVSPSVSEHPLPRMIDAGLYVTLNSDDPPMFNTSLTNEYLVAARAFGWDAELFERLVLNAANAALLPEAERATLIARLEAGFAQARAEQLGA
jgi:adenosine deaminase